MKFIPLTQCQIAIVDDEDYDYLSMFNWSASCNGNTFYAIRKARLSDGLGRKVLKMHRIITNCPPGLEVDHINGFGFDNRRSNLRICTHKENQQSQKKVGSRELILPKEFKEAYEEAVFTSQFKHFFRTSARHPCLTLAT